MGKITACHSCKIGREVENFGVYLQSVVTTDGMVAELIEELRRHYASKCVGCRRVSQDDIRISRTPHAKSELVASYPDRDTPRADIPVDQDVADRWRMALSTMFGQMTPVQLLLIQHLMSGGRLSDFGESLRRTHRQIGRYRGSERAQAGMMRDAIVEKAPFLAPVFAALVGTRQDGSKKPSADDVETDSVKVIKSRMDDASGDLFEFAGVDAPFDELKRKTKR